MIDHFLWLYLYCKNESSRSILYSIIVMDTHCFYLYSIAYYPYNLTYTSLSNWFNHRKKKKIDLQVLPFPFYSFLQNCRSMVLKLLSSVMINCKQHRNTVLKDATWGYFRQSIVILLIQRYKYRIVHSRLETSLAK